MTLDRFFQEVDLEDIFLIGYYGGSNFGDELLLEVIQNILKQKGVNRASFYYADPKMYSTYHHDFGYDLIPKSLTEILRAILKNRSILVGGGGLWGLDFNKNIAAMSVLLFIARFILAKNVYLIGVGSYSSSPKIARFFSALAALSANYIFARDKESYENFRAFNTRTYKDFDLAHVLPNLDLKPYEREATNNTLMQSIASRGRVLLVCARDFLGRHSNKAPHFPQVLDTVIEKAALPTALLLLNSRTVDPGTYAFYENLKKKHLNIIQIFESNCNPILIYLILKRYSDRITILAPQYHMQVLAHLTGTKFVPIRYDNKNEQFYKDIGLRGWLNISSASAQRIRQFI